MCIIKYPYVTIKGLTGCSRGRQVGLDSAAWKREWYYCNLPVFLYFDSAHPYVVEWWGVHQWQLCSRAPFASETQEQIVLELYRYLSYGNHTSNQTRKKPEALGIFDIPEKLGDFLIYLPSGFAMSDMNGKWVSGKKSLNPAPENVI